MSERVLLQVAGAFSSLDPLMISRLLGNRFIESAYPRRKNFTLVKIDDGLIVKYNNSQKNLDITYTFNEFISAEKYEPGIGILFARKPDYKKELINKWAKDLLMVMSNAV